LLLYNVGQKEDEMNFDVRCDRCGETGTINRMDIKAGVCIYCRSEAETSAPPTEPSELDTLRAQNAELLAALERATAWLEDIGFELPLSKEVEFKALFSPDSMNEIQTAVTLARAAIASVEGETNTNPDGEAKTHAIESGAAFGFGEGDA